jgi:signal transduction histidine kinase
MDLPATCPLAFTLAQLMREQKTELAERWLDRISARVALDPNRVFPTDDLLDHVPLLIEGIADYIESPTEEITADFPVVAKARELGELRYAQGFDVYQILKEHELLGGIIFAFLSRSVDDIDEPCTRGELLQCAHRLFRAVQVIQQATTVHFLQLMSKRVSEREERLRGFNRMVSHELKNRVGAISGAHALLTEPFLKPEQRDRFLAMIGENAAALNEVLENLITISRLDTDVRRQRNVLLPHTVREVVRQLRAMAQAHGVRLCVVDPLPAVEVSAAAVELCLTNYISNAIKYSDPSKPDRWVRIEAAVATPPSGGPGCELVVRVRDNGLGVPDAAREHLFERFFRADEARTSGVEGTGLGLSIVRDTVESIGGRAWAEFDIDGSTFAIALPCRRADDH